LHAGYAARRYTATRVKKTASLPAYQRSRCRIAVGKDGKSYPASPGMLGDSGE
jgi:hypothetical protein